MARKIFFPSSVASRRYSFRSPGLPQQLKSVPDDERQKNVPLMYIFAAQKGLAPDAKLAMAMDLNVLMYAGVNDYQAAVKAFQKDIGESATGILTVSQIQELKAPR